MAAILVPAGAKEITIEYSVIRADGTVEPQTPIYWHRNPFKRIQHRVVMALRKEVK